MLCIRHTQQIISCFLFQLCFSHSITIQTKRTSTSSWYRRCMPQKERLTVKKTWYVVVCRTVVLLSREPILCKLQDPVTAAWWSKRAPHPTHTNALIRRDLFFFLPADKRPAEALHSTTRCDCFQCSLLGRANMAVVIFTLWIFEPYLFFAVERCFTRESYGFQIEVCVWTSTGKSAGL